MNIKKINNTLFMLMLSVQMGYGSNYSLGDIIDNVESSSELVKSLEYKKKSLDSLNSFKVASEPLVLGIGANRAKPNYEKDGMEYQVSLSKNIAIGNSRDLEKRAGNLANEAVLLEESKKLIEHSNKVANLYHQSCLDTKNYNLFRGEYSDFQKLYSKKRKAYKYGEISKLELMQLDMDMSEQTRVLEEKKAKEQTSRDLVLQIASLDGGSKLKCSDTFKIKGKFELGDDLFALSSEANKKKSDSNELYITKSSSSFNSVDLSSYYISELTQEKYGVGISMPLEFSSKKREYQKSSFMYQNSELESLWKYKMKQNMEQVTSMLYDLKIAHLKFARLSENIKYYRNTLLPLSRKSYDYAESSAVEYLMAKQKLYALENDLYDTEKKYYTTLFDLYNIVEIRGKK
jgi:hypothetical protein